MQFGRLDDIIVVENIYKTIIIFTLKNYVGESDEKGLILSSTTILQLLESMMINCFQIILSMFISIHNMLLYKVAAGQRVPQACKYVSCNLYYLN